MADPETDRKAQAIRNHAAYAWRQLRSSINTIRMGCEVRPEQATEVFAMDVDPGAIKLSIRPVVFRLYEKANSPSSQVFVSVSGKVNFSVNAALEDPRACFFETEVAYFKIRSGTNVEHVFGIHYDHDTRLLAHPIFHGQMKSMSSHVSHLTERFHLNYSCVEDRMRHINGNIRMPTAHMDPFSVFLQVVSDHMMNNNSGERAKAAFEQARDALGFFRSDSAVCVRLDEVHRQRCFRSGHWYIS